VEVALHLEWPPHGRVTRRQTELTQRNPHRRRERSLSVHQFGPSVMTMQLTSIVLDTRNTEVFGLHSRCRDKERGVYRVVVADV
jgi:hypothetical protein